MKTVIAVLVLIAGMYIGSMRAESRLVPRAERGAEAARHAGQDKHEISSSTEFFETRIRPVLVDQCYSCHNSAKKAEGGLALDSRPALLKGGDGGAIIVPGDPGRSRLLPILRHEIDKLKMPKNTGKLDDRTIAAFEKWIAMGAPDPRDNPPTAAELANATSWETVLAKRKQWWSFQPIQDVSPPVVAGNEWSEQPIDRFILAKLREKGLEPAAPADARTLVRRLFFALTGLPPSNVDVERWTARLRQSEGYAELVDHLLASPQFGEAWARHWMDWVRYADSHGSEGDPDITGAWQYRDYLIRAFNTDVSFDQLLREDIAGDLLEHPRLNKALQINESAIGPAQWRMVYHGFAPTDALEEKVRFIDDEIGTFSKAFLGLTVQCARCHNHKFDAISQSDYYALFGILGSCRPGRVVVDTPEKSAAGRDMLRVLKPKIRTAIAEDWLQSADDLRAKLLSDNGPWTKAEKDTAVLHPLFVLHRDGSDKEKFANAWNRRVDEWKQDRKRRDVYAAAETRQRWNFSSQADYETWFHQGNGLSDRPAAAGEFAIATTGDSALTGIYPAGVYSHLLTAKSAARFSSADFPIDDADEVWLRVIGGVGATSRYVVRDYPRTGTVYPEVKLLPEWKWQRLDMSYWNGDVAHLELATGKDAPVQTNEEIRSWIGVREVKVVAKGTAGPPMDSREFLDPVFQSRDASAPDSFKALADRYVSAISTAISAWRTGSATDAQALLLDACMRDGLLSNRVDQLPLAKPLLEEYRKTEDAVAVPTRVPGLEETVGRDQPIFERGNHKKPGQMVPRRFLQAIDSTPYRTHLSGRRELAEDMLSETNPLTRRVIVNRLWHHLFGRGIVATPDNFGKLGIEPTHPQLLDYLATKFKASGGSMKQMIRSIVISKTWQLSSKPDSKALETDPDNQYLSHAFLRRLDAEAIRDSLLSVSGELSAETFGPPVDGNSARRSIYVKVKRTSLDPFLRAFDFPEPFSAVGRRDATNVPAQSLTMMNDVRVATLAASWAKRVSADTSLANDDARIQAMFLSALGRSAGADEISRLKDYLHLANANRVEAEGKIAALRKELERQQLEVSRRIEPIRARLIDAMRKDSHLKASARPAPISRWDFKIDLTDQVGLANAHALNGAHISGGALVISNQGYAVTEPIKQSLTAKTLEAWVVMDNVDQRGGGLMSIQTPGGAVFDAIVFGEKEPGRWIAGSNFFQRSQPLDGPIERDAVSRPVQLVIAYYPDGKIAGYRDGEPYGKRYQSDGPVEFHAGESVITFGLRHLPVGGNKTLSCRILRAALYDRALSSDEVKATYQPGVTYVSDSQAIAELPESERQQVQAAQTRIAELQSEMVSLSPSPDMADSTSQWIDLARAMFTFKEFIYVR